MTMPSILLSAPYMLAYVDRFRPVFDHFGLDLIVPEVNERLEEDQILAFAGSFDGVICGDDRFSERVIRACLPRLKVISKWGTGVDSIDRDAAARLGVRVGNTPDAFSQPVADSVVGYLLAFARRLPWMDSEMKAGRWNKLMGRSLSECVLGVIGVGNVGKAVIQRAVGFGMTILGNDIVPIDLDFLATHQVAMTSLRDLLGRSDFISINCDLNPTSRHLINPETLAWVKPGAVLINTARGPVVDEAALIDALQAGRLAGAGLDVFEREPLPADSPLLKMDHVLLAPHNANSSPAAWERVHWNTIRNLLEGLGLDGNALEQFRQEGGS